MDWTELDQWWTAQFTVYNYSYSTKQTGVAVAYVTLVLVSYDVF
jgi:hypothetical protein